MMPRSTGSTALCRGHSQSATADSSPPPRLPETPQTVRYRVTAPFRLEPLHGQHDRSTFASGEEALDRYFRTQVTQDLRCRIANCFVAVDVATGQVVAYYTIASASIPNHGFRQLASPPGTLFLPLATAAKILLDPSEL